MSKLLVVDDEVEVCDFLKNFFEEKGNQVFIANDGEEALRIVEKEKPQVMILDLRLPGISGEEVLKRTKELAPEVKVIIASGADDETMKRVQMLGITGTFPKPYSLDKLETDAKKIIPELYSASEEGES